MQYATVNCLYYGTLNSHCGTDNTHVSPTLSAVVDVNSDYCWPMLYSPCINISTVFYSLSSAHQCRFATEFTAAVHLECTMRLSTRQHPNESIFSAYRCIYNYFNWPIVRKLHLVTAQAFCIFSLLLSRYVHPAASRHLLTIICNLRDKHIVIHTDMLSSSTTTLSSTSATVQHKLLLPHKRQASQVRGIRISEARASPASHIILAIYTRTASIRGPLCIFSNDQHPTKCVSTYSFMNEAESGHKQFF